MQPDKRTTKVIKNPTSKQRGASIVIAIFLITVMALLATAAVQIVTTGQQSISQEITSLKAYFASQTGVQWGMYQAVYATPNSSHTLTFSNAGLTLTTVDVSFTSTTIDSNTFYVINANGKYSTSSTPEFSSRQVRLRFKP